ncbi:hypothetical protein M569_16800 [Genlisea aurea]|uniref:Uncharacterized protein n=1 Tax=Genlisea aurea TaxID=192259 RepID=S8D5X4_9LAMI|nr:hypothetical protein M569_16800 [Genlisea aurea]
MILQLQIPASLNLRRTLGKAFYVSASDTVAEDAGIRFRKKVMYLESLNIDTSKALHLNPNLRSAPLSTLQSVTRCLYSMGLDLSSIGRILDMHPKLLTVDPYSDIYPVLDFLLNTVELPFPEVSKSIQRCPRLLVTDVDAQLRPTFEFLSDLGFVGSNRLNSQTSLLLVSSIESTLMRKIDFFVGIGIDYDDVRNMVLRSPGLLTFSIENNLRPKVEYFLNEMKGDLGEIKSFPQYFSFSLERKIRPRHRLLMDYGFSLSLSEMLKASYGDFIRRLAGKHGNPS